MEFIIRLLLVLLSLSYGGEVCGAYTIVVNGTAPDAVSDTSCWTDPPCSTLDLGLQGAQYWLANGSNSIVLIIVEGRYDLSESLYTTFENVSGISIIGSPSNNPPTTVVSCTGNVGFEFVYSSDIVIHGIEFSNCNQPRNSTSITERYTFEQFYVSFYLLYCADISLQNVSITNNNGTGLVIYNPAKTIVIEGSRFLNNQQQQWPEFTAGGGGVFIEFSYCVPYNEAGLDCLKDGISNVDTQFTSDTNISIRNCIFYHNKANATSYLNNTFILPSGQYHYAFGRGGGLSLFFKGSAKSNNVVVDGCSFIQNSALWGGGIFAEFHDNASYNSLTVYSSFVSDNNVLINTEGDGLKEGTGGGGSSIGFVFFGENSVHGNTALFKDCTFDGNTAYLGGGISFYSPKQIHNIPSFNEFALDGCSFTGNRAKFGFALDVTLWQPSVRGHNPMTLISDCDFTDNCDWSQAGTIGIGAVYIESLLATFSGNVVFTSNKGSALSVTSSSIIVEEDALLSFIANEGRNGGAISLLSTSFITLYSNSSLEFINNTADYNGGAIYYFSSGEKNLPSSHNCFLRYHDITALPAQWTSSFYFLGNTANGRPNAIHTPSIFPCLWGDPLSVRSGVSIDRDIFCWNDNWVYTNSTDGERDYNCREYITTAPLRYNLKQTKFEAYPGGLLHLNVSVYDDINNNVTDSNVFLARILGDTASFNGYNYRYVSRGFFVLNGQNSTVNIQLETPDPVVIRTNITVTLRECPPGFALDESDSCVCAGSYNSFIDCDPFTTSSSIDSGVWFGPVEIDGRNETVVGLSPFVSNPTRTFPTDVSISEFLCGNTNREGVLCGSCKPGYGVAVNSGSYECLPCPENQAVYSWIYYLLTEFFLLTVFCLVIFVFGITVTWGPLNAYIYYAQVVTTAASVDADGTIPYADLTSSYDVLKGMYTVPYGVWNMDFLRPAMPRYCLSRSVNAIEILALGYLTALYPLLLLIICISIVQAYSKGVKLAVCLLRPFKRSLLFVQRMGNLRQSVTGGIAAFIVISYTKFCSVSLYMLTPIPLYRADGSTVDTVFYYNGNISYNAEGIVYFLIALTVLATFVAIPPLLLIYPSALRLIERLTKKQLGRLYPSAKLQIFLDEFHGCFKDGTTGDGADSRWFAGLYFMLRIAMYIVYSYTPMWGIHFVTQLMVFILGAVLLVLFRPYRKDWINTLDILMFLLLSAITALSQFSILLTWLDLVEGNLVYVFVVQYVLIFLPLFYFFIYHGLFLARRVRHYCSSRSKSVFKQKSMTNNTAAIIENFDHDERPGLVDSTHVADFLDYLDDTNRLEDDPRSTINTEKCAGSSKEYALRQGINVAGRDIDSCDENKNVQSLELTRKSMPMKMLPTIREADFLPS